MKPVKYKISTEVNDEVYHDMHGEVKGDARFMVLDLVLSPMDVVSRIWSRLYGAS